MYLPRCLEASLRAWKRKEYRLFIREVQDEDDLPMSDMGDLEHQDWLILQACMGVIQALSLCPNLMFKKHVCGMIYFRKITPKDDGGWISKAGGVDFPMMKTKYVALFDPRGMDEHSPFEAPAFDTRLKETLLEVLSCVGSFGDWAMLRWVSFRKIEVNNAGDVDDIVRSLSSVGIVYDSSRSLIGAAVSEETDSEKKFRRHEERTGFFKGGVVGLEHKKHKAQKTILEARGMQASQKPDSDSSDKPSSIASYRCDHCGDPASFATLDGLRVFCGVECNR